MTDKSAIEILIGQEILLNKAGLRFIKAKRVRKRSPFFIFNRLKLLNQMLDPEPKLANHP